MNLIVVVDVKWGIGRDNGLLFRLKKDMAFFRKTTMNKVVVVGANTFNSFPKGALPNRINVVLDSSGNKHDGATTVSTLDELDAELSKYDSDDVYVSGGASIYKLLLDRCKTAYVTKVRADGQAQVFFPNLDELPNWKLIEQSDELDDEGYAIVFCTYKNADFA